METKALIKRASWQIEAFFYWFLRKVLGLFSIRTIYSCGEFLGLVAYFVSRRYRLIVRKNLLLAYGDRYSSVELRKLNKETFQQNGANLLSALCAESKSNEEIFSLVEFHGLDQMEVLLSQNKGVIAVLGHMGNWEILARFKGMLEGDRRLGLLYRPLSNQKVNEMMLEQRNSGGMEMFSYRKSALSIIRLLKKGGVFSIMCDQRIGRGGEYANYLGRSVLCAKFPAVLHRQTGAPVVTVSMKSTGRARWAFYLEEVSFSEESSPHQQIMTALGDALSRSPKDVFWFQDRWKLVSPFLEPRQHKKPIRILLEESDGTAFEQITDRLNLHPEVLEWEAVSNAIRMSEINALEEARGIPFDVTIGFSNSPDFKKESQKAGVSLFIGFDNAIAFSAVRRLVKDDPKKNLEQTLVLLGL